MQNLKLPREILIQVVWGKAELCTEKQNFKLKSYVC